MINDLGFADVERNSPYQVQKAMHPNLGPHDDREDENTGNEREGVKQR